MGGRVHRPTRPPVPTTGRGWRICQASGFTRKAADYVDDVRQGRVAPEFADTTPGFGTKHPQDVVQLGNLSDPTPIYEAAPAQPELSKQDMGLSDQEILAAIREGRPPRAERSE